MKRKTISALKKDLDKVFNKFIRNRDTKDGDLTPARFGLIFERLLAAFLIFGNYISLGTRWPELA